MHHSTSAVVLLRDLADASDALGDALMRHDHAALLTANGRTESVTAALTARAETLTDSERSELASPVLAPLFDRIRAAARRNAVLIEQAWELDAATMRLLVGVGRAQADGQLAAYAAPVQAGYVDRQA